MATPSNKPYPQWATVRDFRGDGPFWKLSPVLQTLASCALEVFDLSDTARRLCIQRLGVRLLQVAVIKEAKGK